MNCMELKKIKLTEIKPAGYNPRKISEEDFKKLKNSIKTFGLTDPIIVNLKNNTIIGGHQRYDVLVDILLEEDNLAEKEFDLIEKGDIGFIFDVENLILKNEDYEKALNIALNKISGEWDITKLNTLVEELKVNNFDLELTGFDDIELEEISLTNEIFDNVQDVDDLNEDDFLFEDNDFDLNYTIRFNSKKEEQQFYEFLDKVNDEFDGSVSTNILDFLEQYIEDNPKKYSSEYELILQDDNEKDRLQNLLYKLEGRNGDNVTLLDLIREV